MGNHIAIERTPHRAPQRRSIALNVAGAGLMLRGRFSDWESGLSQGPDLDKVGVRLAIDSTSVGTSMVGGADEEDPLFSFHSRSVKAAGPGTFVAKGTFTRPEGSRAVEMTVETPPGHTALFVLSFGAEKSDFGEGWADLVENVVPFSSRQDGEPVRQAHAWLTAPVLAAA